MQPIAHKRRPYLTAVVVAFAAAALLIQPAQARFVQQGSKLVASSAVGPAQQGESVAVSADGNTAVIGGSGNFSDYGAAWVYVRNNGVWELQQELLGIGVLGATPLQGTSVAISADGNTAIIGGVGDNNHAGAAWVFTRSNGVWTQTERGSKLVGSGATGSAQQGFSVALSADGNTAIVGGPDDAITSTGLAVGAAWVFARSNGVWLQQGNKLVGTGNVASGSPAQGGAVALSADGNTALVGDRSDNGFVGAVWVFVRSNGVWQQEQKLVGTGAVGNSLQGSSVALSADGNTALIGGEGDNRFNGAAWVFTRSNGAWQQQGNKLVGPPFEGELGRSVALSADGNTAAIGGPLSSIGAVVVFTRSNGVWTQQGGKLVGSGAVDSSLTGVKQGRAVAIAGDAKTIIVGGPEDNFGTGATWVFVQSAAGTHDFNNDGLSDIAWRNTDGSTALWLMSGAQVANVGSFGKIPTSFAIVGQRDFNGDGNHDWLWRDTSNGTVVIWLLNGLQVTQNANLGVVPLAFTVVGTGDFNGDGKGDILWRDTAGNVAIWLMNGTQIAQAAGIGQVPTSWSVVGVADFNGDGKSDILWRDSAGNVAIWLMNGVQIAQSVMLGQVPTNWTVAATGDFNADGFGDILWRDSSSGYLAVWLMNGIEIAQSGLIGMVPNYWQVAETGDFNADAFSDILWRDTTTGAVAIWFMSGLQIAQSAGLGVVTLDWSIQGLNAD